MKIILVRPKDSINIGSVARAVQNFGFSKLYLVSPENYDLDLAKKSACWATKVLDDLKIFHSIKDAISDLSVVIGFSSRSGKNLPPSSSINDWLRDVTNKAIDFDKTGLIFGPEDTGLTNEDLKVVTDFVYIPTSADNPSMNLSHAVAVVLYCFSQFKSDFAESNISLSCEDNNLASSASLDALEKLIFSVCQKNRFFNENTPAEVPNIIGNIFRRSKLSNRDISILQGVFGKSLSEK